MQYGMEIKGRGTSINPQNRFEKLAFTPEPEDVPEEERLAPQTQILRDSSKSIIAHNDSPDIPFSQSINPYRGCEHGCAYCYARPYHEYLGFSAGLDFESKILVKEDAPALLRKELSKPKYEPSVIAISGVTDCYQPIERHLKITRRCLEVLAEFKNPAGLITKNRLVARDADILGEMAKWQGSQVFISITTLDNELCGKLEPRASRPAARLETIRILSQAGVPVGVNAAPMIPGLTDHELPDIIAASVEAGAVFAGYTMVRLPGAVEQIFERWLEVNVPNSFNKVMNRIREAHDGKSGDSRFGTRMRGDGAHAEQLRQLFESACKKAGLPQGRHLGLSTASFKRPQIGQLTLFV